MRFPTKLVLTSALSTLSAAEGMEVWRKCGGLNSKCESLGYFKTSSGEYEVNAEDGCRSIPVPNMIVLCVDFYNQRAHFQYAGESPKRCMWVTFSETYECSSTHCERFLFQEIDCSWYMTRANGEVEAGDMSSTNREREN